MRAGGAQARGQANRLPDADFERLVQEARDRHSMSDVAGRHTKLTGKNERRQMGCCPFHPDRSPSFEVNDQKGTYYCHGCGAGGDQITLLMKLEGMTFRQAVEWLLGDELPVITPEVRVQRKAEDEKVTAERIARARSIWARSVPAGGTPAEVYAQARGITMQLPPSVRFVMTPRWSDAETGECGPDHAAMVCALQSAAGAIVGVQCVFLADGGRRKYEGTRPDGSKSKAKLSYGVIVGSAFRLGPVAEHLVVTEGPEDGLTLAQQLPGKSVWVSCGTALMSRLEYPPEVGSVCFAGDNNAAGRAAVEQATEATLALGLKSSATYPNPRFKDWNDQLRGIEA